jgi:hypothetical protein
MNLAYFTKNWKTTLQSILTVTLALTGALMMSNTISPKVAAIAASVNGIAKVVIGVFQSDGVQVPAGSTVTQTTKVETPAP